MICLSDSLLPELNEWMNEWTIEWMNKWMNIANIENSTLTFTEDGRQQQWDDCSWALHPATNTDVEYRRELHWTGDSSTGRSAQPGFSHKVRYGEVKRTFTAPFVKLQLKSLRYGSHRVAPANYTIPASTLRTFARWRHLNGRHLIQLATHLSTPEWWKAALA